MPCEHVPWTSPAAGLVFAAAALAICFKLAVAAALYTKRKEDAVRFAPTTPLATSATPLATSATPLATSAAHPTTPRPLPFHHARAYALSAQVRFSQPLLSFLLVGGAVALDLTVFTLPGEASGGACALRPVWFTLSFT